MAINLMNLKVNVPKVRLEDYVFTIYGRPKAGKSTLFAKLVNDFYGSADAGLLIGFERGFNALKVVAQPCDEFTDFIEIVDQLEEGQGKLPFKFIAIDTIDVMYKQAVSYVLKRESRKDGKKYQAINDIPWGKGHEYIEIEISTQLERIKRLGLGLFMITHDKDKKFESREGVSYDKTTCSLPDRIRNTILNMSDFINFIDIAKEKDEILGKLVDKRYIYFRADGSDLEAGSRFENVPNKIEYDSKLFIETFENAVKSSLESNQDINKLRKEQEEESRRNVEEYIKNNGVAGEYTIEEKEEKLNIIKSNISKLDMPKLQEIMKEYKISNFNDASIVPSKALDEILKLI